MFDWVSWLVASARTVTASVCVPALPPMPATIGISTASTAYLPISLWKRLTTRRRDDRGAEVDDQPEQPAAHGHLDRLVDVALARAGQQQDVLARFFLDDVDDVVDGDHADQPACIVDHRGGDQRIFLEAQRDFLLVHVDRDQRLLALHDVADCVARGVRRIVESLQVPTGWWSVLTTNTSQKSVGRSSVDAQVIDHLADLPMFGHRDEVALHQAAGGFLRIAKRFLDRGAVVGLHRPQHGPLLVLVEVLDQRDRVVGLELPGDVGDLLRLQLVDQVLADIIVHFGEHVGG